MKIITGQYQADTLVAVYPFTRQTDDEEVTIGRPDTNVFLVLPSDAVELLDFLAAGNTVGEARSLYEAKYGEVPDMEFLEYLDSKGFVRPLDNNDPSAEKTIISELSFTKSSPVRFHFINFPQSLAQKLFGSPVLTGCGMAIALAVVAVVIEPSIVPNWKAYFFEKHAALTVLTLIAIDCVALFIHEMAHLVAAKAVGVSCRIGISHRLWVLVAETDMTGIWAIPRNQRYLPFLAGPLVDATSIALLILVFFAQSRGWLRLSPSVFQIGQAILLTYLLQILWQCYFFVRTDFYYVFANFFRCKNLLKDTEVHLRNQISRWFSSVHRVNQSHIPLKERRVIRWYAILWVTGRVAALTSLILISIPVMWHYFFSLFAVLRAGYAANPYGFIDALLLLAIVFTPQGVGFWLWIRSFRQERR
jgi:putative peptide zinc metalloprotease protein